MTIGGFQSNWFNVTTHTLENGNLLPTATLKDEYKDDFAAYTKNVLEQLEQREPSAGLDALTDEQLKELSEKYDTDDMTYDEYQSFLRDLVDMGALTETDRWLAGGAKKGGRCVHDTCASLYECIGARRLPRYPFDVAAFL